MKLNFDVPWARNMIHFSQSNTQFKLLFQTIFPIAKQQVGIRQKSIITTVMKNAEKLLNKSHTISSVWVRLSTSNIHVNVVESDLRSKYTDNIVMISY